MVPLFPYLAVRYGVGDVPTTVVNGRIAVVGPQDEDAYLAEVLARA
jgi:predicted DsbA family dithiol-disulfide isomerase